MSGRGAAIDCKPFGFIALRLFSRRVRCAADKGFAGRLVIEQCFALPFFAWQATPIHNHHQHHLWWALVRWNRTHPFSLANFNLCLSVHSGCTNNGLLIGDYVTLECAKWTVGYKEKVARLIGHSFFLFSECDCGCRIKQISVCEL